MDSRLTSRSGMMRLNPMRLRTFVLFSIVLTLCHLEVVSSVGSKPSGLLSVIKQGKETLDILGRAYGMGPRKSIEDQLVTVVAALRDEENPGLKNIKTKYQWGAVDMRRNGVIKQNAAATRRPNFQERIRTLSIAAEGSSENMAAHPMDSSVSSPMQTTFASVGFQNEIYLVETSGSCLRASDLDSSDLQLLPGCSASSSRYEDYDRRWLVNTDNTIRSVVRTANGVTNACISADGGIAIDTVLELQDCDPALPEQQWNWRPSEGLISPQSNSDLCFGQGPLRSLDGLYSVKLVNCTSGIPLQWTVEEEDCNSGVYVSGEFTTDQIDSKVCVCPLYHMGNQCELDRPVTCKTTFESSVAYDCDKGRMYYNGYKWENSGAPPCRVVDDEIESMEVTLRVECAFDESAIVDSRLLNSIMNVSSVTTNFTYWALAENNTYALGDDPGLSVQAKAFNFYMLSDETQSHTVEASASILVGNQTVQMTMPIGNLPNEFYIDGRLYIEIGLSDKPPGSSVRGASQVFLDFPSRRALTQSIPVDLLGLWISLGILGALIIVAFWFARRMYKNWLMDHDLFPKKKKGVAHDVSEGDERGEELEEEDVHSDVPSSAGRMRDSWPVHESDVIHSSTNESTARIRHGAGRNDDIVQ